MAVVLVSGGFDALDRYETILESVRAIPFPKFPDPIFMGYGFMIHVTTSPENVQKLTKTLNKAGMGIVTDRWAAQRQGPLQPRHRYVEYKPL